MINKHNWREYCTESELSPDELESLRKLSNLACDDIQFYEYLTAQTESEYKQSLINNDSTYESLVKWCDANKRLKRAEIKTYNQFINKEK